MLMANNLSSNTYDLNRQYSKDDLLSKYVFIVYENKTKQISLPGHTNSY